MEKIWDDIVAYDNELASKGIRLEDLEFVDKNVALITSLGIEPLEVVTNVSPISYVQEFDLSKPYNIYTEDLYHVTELRYNIDKKNGTYKSFKGPKAKIPFLQLLAMEKTIRSSKANPNGTKSEVTDFTIHLRK